jgi:hypothetical protein
MMSLLKDAYRIQRDQGTYVLLLRTLNRYNPEEKRFNIRKSVSSTVTDLRNNFHQRVSDAPPELKPIRVSPSSIESYTEHHSFTKGFGQIQGGDWDRETINDLHDHWIFQGLVERYSDENAWEDTEYFKKGRENYCGVFGYIDEEEFLIRQCSYVDRLYQKIRQEGYSEGNSYACYYGIQKNWVRSYTYPEDIIVVIGRDGEIYLRDGFHRFTIAKLLGIDPIPVRILSRHKQWQRKREQVVSENDDESSEEEHPDFDRLL